MLRYAGLVFVLTSLLGGLVALDRARQRKVPTSDSIVFTSADVRPSSIATWNDQRLDQAVLLYYWIKGGWMSGDLSELVLGVWPDGTMVWRALDLTIDDDKTMGSRLSPSGFRQARLTEEQLASLIEQLRDSGAVEASGWSYVADDTPLYSFRIRLDGRLIFLHSHVEDISKALASGIARGDTRWLSGARAWDRLVTLSKGTRLDAGEVIDRPILDHYLLKLPHP